MDFLKQGWFSQTQGWLSIIHLFRDIGLFQQMSFDFLKKIMITIIQVKECECWMLGPRT